MPTPKKTNDTPVTSSQVTNGRKPAGVNQLHEVSTSSSPIVTGLDDSTARIQQQLRLIQADDVAQMGKTRRIQGKGNLITAGYEHSQLTWSNLKRYIYYVTETWSVYIMRQTSGKLTWHDAVSVIGFAIWGTVSLAVIWFVCLIGTLPPLMWLWRLKNGNASLVNANIPHFFETLSAKQCDAAKEKLSAKPDPTAHNPRNFDMDIAALFLQISSLMYERDPNGSNSAIQEATERSDTSLLRRELVPPADGDEQGSDAAPGAVINSLFESSDVARIIKTLDATAEYSEAFIKDFTKRYGLAFAVASELQTTSQAYCSLFWEPKGKWVVVAFKGTDPTSFDEWATDFTCTFVDASRDIPGFSYLHKGFKDRILPSEGRQPYKSIAAAVKVVCKELVRGQPDGTKINVWFTGHSLGCSLASIAYATALFNPKDFGPHALLRDAYCYATPITCDIKSRLVFNHKMEEDTQVPRTLWRITNRDDFVATGLPDLGDGRVEGFGADNMLNFCHLGVEIYMKDSPNPCCVAGDAVRAPAGYKVHFTSKFDAATLRGMRDDLKKKGWVQPFYITWMQYLPFVGSMAAHGTTNYWEQLQRIAMLPAVERTG
ncbi:hypothetical protein FRB96_004936 [Tulasnella sp. 330]|nr:hypothetical protein FRB96_004936 [Tulasnella sp. 330]